MSVYRPDQGANVTAILSKSFFASRPTQGDQFEFQLKRKEYRKNSTVTAGDATEFGLTRRRGGEGSCR